MDVLPPGTLLQLMYLERRLNKLQPGRFIEIGPGSGEITQLLLKKGWTGRSYDLEENTIYFLKNRFSKEIAEDRFELVYDDFLSSDVSFKVDIVISSMVMEHLDVYHEHAFMVKAAECLKQGGIMIALVPASPQHWGIEDEIAGHCRRYTRSCVKDLAAVTGWKLLHMVGLTFPVSNFLLPISNYIVHKNERSKLSLSPLERTKLSGIRKIKYKTEFPSLLALFLNKITLLPLYYIQKLFAKSERALVLYFEAQYCKEKDVI